VLLPLLPLLLLMSTSSRVATINFHTQTQLDGVAVGLRPLWQDWKSDPQTYRRTYRSQTGWQGADAVFGAFAGATNKLHIDATEMATCGILGK